MRRWPLFFGVLCLWFGLACSAARAADLGLSPSDAVTCMTPPIETRGKPDYPAEALDVKEGGSIGVVLTFHAPDQPPDVEVIGPDESAVLVDAVKAHVSRLRVPCMTKGAELVQLRQRYTFVPNAGRKVMAGNVSDDGDAVRQAKLACVSHVAGRAARPSYPQEAERAGHDGKVYVRLRFTAAGEPPQVTVLSAPPDHHLTDEVVSFAQGFRMPCVDTPIEASWLFNFRFEGDPPHTILRDGPLVAFLRDSGKNLVTPAFFDFDTMGCPFDLRLTYRMPASANVLRELDNTNPRRRPFMDWLSKLEFDVSARRNNELLDETADIHVPCGKLDL